MSKVFKVEKKIPGIISFIDGQLNSRTSYRKLSQIIIEKYKVFLSHETLRQYDIIRKTGKSPKDDSSHELYYVILPIH